MTTNLTVTTTVHFTQSRRGRKRMATGEAPMPTVVPIGHVPHISRLMALAIRFDDLLAKGEVVDYADLARLGHVTRARTTQIMNLLNLAPDIQEAILHLPPTESGRDVIKEWQVRPIGATVDWTKQRRLWRGLVRDATKGSPSLSCRHERVDPAHSGYAAPISPTDG